MSLAGRLQDLQTLDLQIARTEQELAGLNSDGARARLEELTREAASRDRTVQELSRRLKELEGENADTLDKARKLADQFYQVTSAKELSSLEVEQGRTRERLAALEAEILELMERLETLEAEQLEGRDRCEAQATELAQQEETVRARREDLSRSLNHDRARRIEMARALPEESLKIYEQLRMAKKGVAVAAIRGVTCDGCHMDLPDSRLKHVRNPDALERCTNCGRILVAR